MFISDVFLLIIIIVIGLCWGYNSNKIKDNYNKVINEHENKIQELNKIINNLQNDNANLKYEKEDLENTILKDKIIQSIKTLLSNKSKKYKGYTAEYIFELICLYESKLKKLSLHSINLKSIESNIDVAIKCKKSSDLIQKIILENNIKVNDKYFNSMIYKFIPLKTYKKTETLNLIKTINSEIKIIEYEFFLETIFNEAKSYKSFTKLINNLILDDTNTILEIQVAGLLLLTILKPFSMYNNKFFILENVYTFLDFIIYMFMNFKIIIDKEKSQEMTYIFTDIFEKQLMKILFYYNLIDAEEYENFTDDRRIIYDRIITNNTNDINKRLTDKLVQLLLQSQEIKNQTTSIATNIKNTLSEFIIEKFPNKKYVSSDIINNDTVSRIQVETLHKDIMQPSMQILQNFINEYNKIIESYKNQTLKE